MADLNSNVHVIWDDAPRCNEHNIAAILRRMADQCEADENDALIYAQEIDDLLGQCDPRGDHRG